MTIQAVSDDEKPMGDRIELKVFCHENILL